MERGALRFTKREPESETRTERDDGLTGEKVSRRIQAESSCEDLSSPDGICKTA